MLYTNPMKKGAFFDRDGTLIIDKHYLHDPEQVEYLPGIFEKLKALQEQDYLIFIVTNQSGIGRGYFAEDDMHKVHQKIVADFATQGITISDIAFCPHSPDDNCKCRKPHPKMILDLVEKHQIDQSLSFMVGDKDIDIQAGVNAGMKGIHIKEFIS